MKFNPTQTGILLATALIAFSCTSRQRTIEIPAYGARLFSPVEIEKIELTDSSSVISMKMFTPYIFGVNVDSGIYIRAGEQKYPIVKAEGIELGKRNAKADTFKLYFPAIGLSNKRIDLIDETAMGTKIWDIELTSGNKTPKITLPASEGAAEFALPVPEMKVGESKINVRYLGYDKRYGNDDVNMLVVEPVSRDAANIKGQLDDNGECSFEFTQYGFAKIVMSNPFNSCSFFMAPGETVNVFVNLPEVSRVISPLQKERYEAVPQVSFTGKYAQLNDLMNNSPFVYPEDETPIAEMDADTYVKYKTARYDAIADSIRSLSQPDGYRQYLLIKNDMSLLSDIIYGPRLIEIANIRAGKKDADTKKVVMEDKHFAILKKMNNEYLPYLDGGNMKRILTGIGDAERIKKIIGEEKGPVVELATITPIFDKLTDMEKPGEQQYATLSSIGNPFYKEIFDLQSDAIQKKFEDVGKLKDVKICKVPEVRNQDQLFDAIVAPYKGKVVFVDFWATWCGPCRNAMRLADPVKEKLKGKDVVYVYITGKTSPKSIWIDMLPDIHGDHYYLTQEQWSHVCKQFGIRGIPYYKLIDKQGKTVLAQSGFMGAEEMQKMIEKEL